MALGIARKFPHEESIKGIFFVEKFLMMIVPLYTWRSCQDCCSNLKYLKPTSIFQQGFK